MRFEAIISYIGTHIYTDKNGNNHKMVTCVDVEQEVPSVLSIEDLTNSTYQAGEIYTVGGNIEHFGTGKNQWNKKTLTQVQKLVH